MELRKRTPSRRDNPKILSDYHQYKDDLREDFNCRCGYCDDHDYFRKADYQIDHFVPRTQLRNIKLNDYSNLVYACRSCNRAKSNKWPSGDENVANDGDMGFIDPCNESYDQHFSRNVRGDIIPESKLGLWMWKALNLGNPIHAFVWKLEQIRIKIDDLQSVADDCSADMEVSTMLNKLNKEFRYYLDQLQGGAPIF